MITGLGETEGKDAKNVSDLIIWDKHKKNKPRVCHEREDDSDCGCFGCSEKETRLTTFQVSKFCFVSDSDP